MRFTLKLSSQWIDVSPSAIRQFMLEPHWLDFPYQDMEMSPKKGGMMIPVHLPDLKTIKALSPVLEKFLRWWMLSKEAQKGQFIVPPELEFMCDPIPVLPQVRRTWPLSARNPIKGTFGETTNALMVLATTEKFNQVEIKVIIVKEVEEGDCEMELEFMARKETLWSRRNNEFIHKIDPLTNRKFKEFSKTRKTPDPMIIVAWNCRGIARRGFQSNIRHLFKEHLPQILILTETKTSPKNTARIMKKTPFEKYVLAEPYGLAGGIIVMWNPNFINFQMIGRDLHTIHGIVEVNTSPPFSFCLSAVYASTKYKSRLETWHDLIDMSKLITVPWVVMGDFNEVTCQSEKLGGNLIKQHRADRYSDAMNECGLVDAGCVGSRFTWFNKQKDKPIYQRLDRAWVNMHWLNLFPNSTVITLPREASDHNPIKLITENIGLQNHGHQNVFKMEPLWYAEPGFSTMVDENLNADNSDLVSKLNNISKTMSSWVKDNIENIFKKRKVLCARIMGIQRALEHKPTNKHLLDLNEDLSNELGLIYEQEEAFWMARARTSWIENGDKNTSYFQKSVIIRRRRNKITSLRSEVGQDIQGKDLVPHIVSYFSTLFTSEQTIPPCENHHYSNEISIDHATNIEEVGRAVFDLGPLKAPGIDGLHAHFYQQHWGVLWKDLYKYVDNVLQTKTFPQSINDTTICIIPKTALPESIKQFRPISLCNASYKIVSKILVNRIRPLLKDIISPNQNSFLPGRGCEVNYIAASEILHSMKTKKGKFGWFALKIDLEKAYDRLEWNFIRFCLARKGFDRNSTDLILNCIASPATSIIVNGKPSPSFKTTRGIRQGDPISPYVFIICMEYLADMISEAASKENWKPFYLKRNGIPITHLMFADDLLLFGDTSAKTLSGMKEVLRNFWDCSGQKMNNSKSKIYFSKHTPQNQKDLFCNTLEVQPSPDLGTYLGFPLTDKRPTKNQTLDICRKIKSKLASWKAKCLSKAGRLVLIKSTLTTIANYSMQILYLPKKTLQTIDQACANFLWDSEPQKKKTHLVAWLKACGPLEVGGLSVRSAVMMNKVLMTKLCWKFNTGENLASILIKEKYVDNRPYPAPFSKGSHIWQNVGKGWNMYKDLTAWCIGDGTQINLWLDNWTGKGSLRSLIQGPLTRDEFAHTVSDIRRDGHWNLSCISFTLPTDLIQWIQAIPIPQFGEDAPFCSLSKGLHFDSKTAYNTIWNTHFPDTDSSDKWSCIWKARCPPKLKIFLWLILWGRLPTASHLSSRQIIPNGNCQFCPNTQEDMVHLFLNCPRATEFWSNIEFQPKYNHLHSDVENWFLDNLNDTGLSQVLNTTNQTIFIFCLWRIWNRRNLWIFQKENKNIQSWCHQTLWLAKEHGNIESKGTQQIKPVHLDPPSPSNYFVKCDASFCSSTLLASYAAICRNEDHTFMAGIAGTFTSTSAAAAETQSILIASSWVIIKAWQNVTIFTDCKSAAEHLNNDNPPISWLSNLYAKCRELQRTHGSLWVKFRRREHIMEADYVARKTKDRLSLLDQGSDLEPPPSLTTDISSNNDTNFLGACLLQSNWAICACILTSTRSGVS
ncbi:uncharacterized protein [Spinacia oleracea]|uniref:Reverse transcriptase domain-containing protein n=1 Tax=Spinacia oleracea TaxID=3562 RepID=A0ABM3R418_SPIOL|nr:uncharacterized protein LOC130465575 [Spinacia oleracea]